MRYRPVLAVLAVVLAGCAGPVAPTGGGDGADGTATGMPAGNATIPGEESPTTATTGTTPGTTTGETPTSSPTPTTTATDEFAPDCSGVGNSTDDLPGYGGDTDRDRRIESDEGTRPDLAYDPNGVLRRVECLRNLTATDDVVLSDYPASDATRSGRKTDVDDELGAIGETGALALQLYSSERVAVSQSPGYTYRGNETVRVHVMNESDLRRYFGESQRVVLAHELVHALQIQHDLVGHADPETTDEWLAAVAMREGDATVVAEQFRRRYVGGTGGATRSIGQRNGTVSRARWPGHLFSQTYRHGYRYFRARNATPADRSAAVRDPPNTTAAVLHPRRDSGTGSGVGTISIPPVDLPDVTRRDDDRVGELPIRYALRANGIRYPRAVRAAEGWRDGRMVYYVRSGPSLEREVVHWRTRWANGSEAREFVDTWRSLLDGLGATRDGDLLVVPGADHRPAVRYRIERSGATVDVVAGENATLVRDVWKEVGTGETG